MEIRKAMGRKSKVIYTTMLSLADAIQHNSSISEACHWAGISRTTFFYYMRTNDVFKNKMIAAKKTRIKCCLVSLQFPRKALVFATFSHRF